MLVTGQASAADAPLKPLYKAPPVLVTSWSGFYLGASVGFRADEADPKVSSATFNQVGFPAFDRLTGCGDLPCTTGQPARGPAFRVAPYVGINWQVGQYWVVGAEADFGFARGTTTLNGMFYPATNGMTGLVTDSFEVKTGWDASARLRAGYLLTPSLLFYATGGAAWMRLDTTSNCGVTAVVFGALTGPCANFFPALGFNGLSPGLISHSTTRSGWTVGGGMEAALWSNWILRTEYRYSDYGTFSVTETRNCPAPCIFGLGVTAATETISYDVHLRTHTASFGLAYKFGDPIVAAAGEAPRGFYKAPPIVALAPSWTGGYVGLGFGIRATKTDATVNSDTFGFGGLAGCTTCSNSEPLNDSSARFSPYLGYIWQVASWGVVGLEGDWGLASRTTTLSGMQYPDTISFTGSANDSFAVKTGWDASIRARAGVLVAPAVLAYATGGPAWLHLETTSTCSINGGCPAGGLSPAIVTQSTTRLGWTVGGGFEVAIWENFLARGEYRYADFGTVSNTDTRSCVGALCEDNSHTASYDVHVRAHIATIGIAYKFANVVAAKY